MARSNSHADQSYACRLAFMYGSVWIFLYDVQANVRSKIAYCFYLLISTSMKLSKVMIWIWFCKWREWSARNKAVFCWNLSVHTTICINIRVLAASWNSWWCTHDFTIQKPLKKSPFGSRFKTLFLTSHGIFVVFFFHRFLYHTMSLAAFVAEWCELNVCSFEDMAFCLKRISLETWTIWNYDVLSKRINNS